MALIQLLGVLVLFLIVVGGLVAIFALTKNVWGGFVLLATTILMMVMVGIFVCQTTNPTVLPGTLVKVEASWDEEGKRAARVSVPGSHWTNIRDVPSTTTVGWYLRTKDGLVPFQPCK